MLDQSENEALSRVGPGAVMGDLMRRYWIPFYLASDLERGGRPARVRLLGEELIVFRDSAGAFEDGVTMFTAHAYVPMDDAHVIAFAATWHPTRPLTDGELAVLREISFLPELIQVCEEESL